MAVAAGSPSPEGATRAWFRGGATDIPESPKAQHGAMVVSASSAPRMLQDGQRKGRVRSARAGCMDWLLGTWQGQWVGLISVGLGLIVCGTVTWKLNGGNNDYGTSWKHCVWISWGLFFDPGTQTGISADDPNAILWTALVFSVMGFIYNLSVLGIIVETARSVMTRWKLERFKIVMTDHVLVLGWTDKTLFLLEEILKEAENRGSKRQKVVVLADRGELEMKGQVKAHLGDSLAGHTVKFHRGCIYNPKDLLRVSVASARDIILLGRGGPADEADLEAVRVMVALAALPVLLNGRVLAEVRCANTAPVLEALLPSVAEGIHARSAVNRMLCYMATQPAVGDCLACLSSFSDGDELYLVRVPLLDGSSFGKACRHFAKSVCVGLKPAGQQVVLAPPDERVLLPTDRLLLIAPDETAIAEQGRGASQLLKQQQQRLSTGVMESGNQLRRILTGQPWDSVVAPKPSSPAVDLGDAWHGLPSIFVMIGWPDEVGDLLMALDCQVPPDTTLHLLSAKTVPEREESLAACKACLRHLRLEHHVGKGTAVEHLEALPLAQARAILVLAEGQEQRAQAQDGASAIAKDSACLACAVTICSLCDGRYGQDLARQLRGRVICELLDPRTDGMLARNKELRKRCIFFRSNALETGLFAMASSEPVVFNTLQLLLMPSSDVGSLFSWPLARFVYPTELPSAHADAPGKGVAGGGGEFLLFSFWDLHARVRRCCGGLLIGWQKASTGAWNLGSSTGRSETLPWSPTDRLLVISRSAEATQETRAAPVGLDRPRAADDESLPRTPAKQHGADWSVTSVSGSGGVPGQATHDAPLGPPGMPVDTTDEASLASVLPSPGPRQLDGLLPVS